MNTERYVWPVIIAASLHGLLLLSFTDTVVIYPPGKPKEGPRENPPPVERIQMIPEDTNQAAAPASGGVPDPLPPTPDLPRELPKEDIFRVEVTESVVSIKPVPHLTKIPERFGEPGDGPGLRNGPPGPTSHLNLDRAPRATVQPAPAFPEAMRQSATSGSVTVEFVVDTTGRVVTADAVRWTHREFVDPAVRAVLRWRFEPGTVSGRKVSFRMAVPIEFNAGG